MCALPVTRQHHAYFCSFAQMLREFSRLSSLILVVVQVM